MTRRKVVSSRSQNASPANAAGASCHANERGKGEVAAKSEIASSFVATLTRPEMRKAASTRSAADAPLSFAECVRALAAAGVRAYVEGDDLVLSGAGSLTPEVRESV